MTETEFNEKVDALFARVGVAIDQAEGDLDWLMQQGVLEVECADGSKIILSRHAPNRQIWVAARSGGFHFELRNGKWLDTRSGTELAPFLATLFAEQGKTQVATASFS